MTDQRAKRAADGAEPFRQLMRFGISGAALTLLVSLLYLAGIAIPGVPPALSLTVATLLASIVGYFVHSGFSFRGHGARNQPALRFTRFLVTNGLGYLMNLGFVFLLVHVAGLPEWTPIIPFCVVTPLVSFFLNRTWVFG